MMQKLYAVLFALVLLFQWSDVNCWAFRSWQGCLPSYRWQSRLLVIVSPSMSDEAYRQQLQETDSNVCEMALRDLVVISIFNIRDINRSKVTRMVYKQHLGVPETRLLNHREGHRIVDCLGMDKDRFNMVLIGSDGYKKNTYRYPTSMATVFRRIDSMPMRRREMQEQARNDIYCY